MQEDKSWIWKVVGAFLVTTILLLIAIKAVELDHEFLSGAGANWVQAIGSLVGLGIAIAIPLRLRQQESREARAREVAEGYVAALSVIGLIPQMRSCCNAIARTIVAVQLANEDIDAARLAYMVNSIRLPLDEEIRRVTLINVHAGAGIVATRTIVSDIISAVRGADGFGPHAQNVEEAAAARNFMVMGELENAQTGSEMLTQLEAVLREFTNAYFTEAARTQRAFTNLR